MQANKKGAGAGLGQLGYEDKSAVKAVQDESEDLVSACQTTCAANTPRLMRLLVHYVIHYQCVAGGLVLDATARVKDGQAGPLLMGVHFCADLELTY